MQGAPQGAPEAVKAFMLTLCIFQAFPSSRSCQPEVIPHGCIHASVSPINTIQSENCTLVLALPKRSPKPNNPRCITCKVSPKVIHHQMLACIEHHKISSSRQNSLKPSSRSTTSHFEHLHGNVQSNKEDGTSSQHSDDPLAH